MKVYMSGQAGLNKNARWEGVIISEFFNIPNKVGLYCVVYWETWTGKDQRDVSPYTNIHRFESLKEIVK